MRTLNPLNFESSGITSHRKVRNKSIERHVPYGVSLKFIENQKSENRKISSFLTIYLSHYERNSAPEFLLFSELYFKI